MPEFKRENRYVVLKISDMQQYLPEPIVEYIRAIGMELDSMRKSQGKAPMQCVVVESDWPEYEPTWQAIERRMTSK